MFSLSLFSVRTNLTSSPKTQSHYGSPFCESYPVSSLSRQLTHAWIRAPITLCWDRSVMDLSCMKLVSHWSLILALQSTVLIIKSICGMSVSKLWVCVHMLGPLDSGARYVWNEWLRGNVPTDPRQKSLSSSPYLLFPFWHWVKLIIDVSGYDNRYVFHLGGGQSSWERRIFQYHCQRITFIKISLTSCRKIRKLDRKSVLYWT